MEFFRLKTREEVLALLSRFGPVGKEEISLAESWGRILAQEVRALENVPGFLRASMDGYAVRSRDTFGATPGLPQYLEVRGQVPMGRVPEGRVGPGEAFRIATGGMLPEGADAVVMVEYTAELPDGTVEVRRPVAPGENVLRVGEDVRAGEVLLKAGHRLRIQDLGLLAALGLNRLWVYKKPRVAIFATGDEVVPVQHSPGPGKVRDANSYLAAAQVVEGGGLPLLKGIIPDDRESLKKALAAALSEAEALFISGGSSVGSRDLTLAAIRELPGGEILVHGVAMRPGKPTIVAEVQGKPLLGLPGHPASAAVVLMVLGRPLLHRLTGRGAEPLWGRTVRARLSRNLAGAGGREDFVRVRLRQEGETLLADPVLGSSGLLSPLVKSDGLVVIPLGVEGLLQGDEVTVHLFPA